MKKILGLGFIIVLLAGCLKDNNKDNVCGYNDVNIVVPQSETDSLQAYLNSKGITATKHGSGVFYTITTPGTGAGIINLCSNITVDYKGQLTNGFAFDSSSVTGPLSIALGRLIPGWQKVIPLIKEGGEMTLYIPPSLGYGSQASAKIPANSILIFDLDLLDVF